MHGDRDAFGILATRAMDRLVGTAGLILHDRDAADDAAQDALIRAWRDLPGLRDADRFDGWLYRILVRSATTSFGVVAASTGLSPHPSQRPMGRSASRSGTSSRRRWAAFRQPIGRLWCCITTWDCPIRRSRRSSASPSAPSSPG